MRLPRRCADAYQNKEKIAIDIIAGEGLGSRSISDHGAVSEEPVGPSFPNSSRIALANSFSSIGLVK